MIAVCRVVAIGLGLAILLWQAVNAVRGEFLHPFLIADVVAAALLLVGGALPRDRASAPVMLAAFSTTGGVFLAASTAAILGDGFSLGRLMAGFGMIPCLACSAALARSR
jgi:hypothetical protein